MNKYQKLFNELQKEQQTIYQDVNDSILVIDGLNTFIRAFGATPSTNEDGEHIGGITGFLYSVGKIVRDFKPTRCIIVFDGKGGSNRRKTINSSYKSNRANKTRLRRHDHQQFVTIEDEQESMRHQFSRLISYLDYLPVTFLSIDGIEADDTIAYIVNMYSSVSKQITIVSTDRDFYQLISHNTKVWSPVKKKMYDTSTLIDEYGVHPNNYVLYRTFTGDKSDNIAGVHGIGPKTLLKHLPQLSYEDEFTLNNLFDISHQQESEIKTFSKINENKHIIEENYQLMNLKSLDFSASHSSNIRKILESSIPLLNKVEFQKLFMQDKMWTTMKNAPEWLSKTWMSLHAFAQQTH